METEELDHAIEELEQRVERLRALYEQYFLGIEKIEPAVARKDVDRRLWLLRRAKIRNTAKRFMLQNIIQRYNTYQQYWLRTCREIENGTFKRHLRRAELKFGKPALTIAAKKRRRTEVESDAEPSVPAPRDANLALGSEEVSSGDELDRAFSQLETDTGGAAAKARPSPSLIPRPGGPPYKSAPPPLPAPLRPPSGGPQAAPARTAIASNAHIPPAKPVVPARVAPGAGPQAASVRSASMTPGPSTLVDSAPANPAPVRPRLAAIPPKTVAHGSAASASAAPGEVARHSSDKPAPPKISNAGAVPAPSTAPLRPALAPAKVAAPAVSAAQPSRSAAFPSPAVSNAAAPLVSAGSVATPAATRGPTTTSRALSDDRIRQLHGELSEQKQKTGALTQISLDALGKSLRETEAKLRHQHGDKSIDFRVVLKDGKAIVKPVVR